MSLDDLLIPARKLRPTDGALRWPEEVLLVGADQADALPLEQLAGDLKARFSLDARVVPDAPRASVRADSSDRATVRLVRDAAVAGPEAYRLRVTPRGAEIASSTGAGAYYAVQTLRDLLAACGRRTPACEIDDAPDFPRRGVYHDGSRGKVPTVATLKALVERLARWKINELQLYVENVFTFRSHPAIGRGYSPLTPEEIGEVREHCRRHHVRLVGSLASFGHMEKILMLDEYSHLGEMPGYRGLPGGTTLCPLDAGSIELVADLYSEFVPLFEARDFNVCCDETWELGKGRSEAEARRVGVGRLYLDFLRKLHELCGKYGKRMNAWADIVLAHPEVLGELPRDVVMLNWDYAADGARIGRTREIAEAGLALVVCPGTSGWQAHGTRLPNAMGNVSRFAAEGRAHGAEGLLNTDWGDNGHRNFLGASLHGFAHGAAHAWHGEGVDDEDFTRRFCLHAFGAGRELADFLGVLGSTYLTCGAPHGNQCALYYAAVEPIAPDAQDDRAIDGVDPDGAERILRELPAATDRLRRPEGLADFEALAWDELLHAARMDLLGCRRALRAAELKAGRSVPAATLRELADETRAVAVEFERLWNARNKPSRLCDNMALFAAAEREARRLAGGAP